MKRTASQFQQAAADRSITAWDHHACSLCGHMVRWLFRDDGRVYFDSGCGCTWGDGPQPCTWEDVAAHYNLQSHPSVISEYDQFWGFAALAAEAQEGDQG